MVEALGTAGFKVFPFEQPVADWAGAAFASVRKSLSDPAIKAAQMRHGDTWFVGVDALENAPDGSIEGIALRGSWLDLIEPPQAWHRAQVSILYPNYPRQDSDESDAAHRYRITRFAAHVDGLLPVGPQRRRFLQEPHAFIVGLPLNDVEAAPLMVWPASHRIMGAAFRAALKVKDPSQVDVTDIYQAARRDVFETIAPVPVMITPGQTVLLHRHLLHGVAPWGECPQNAPNGRVIAYFRPEFKGLGAEWRDAP